MNRIILFSVVFFIVCFNTPFSSAEELRVGDKAPTFTMMDASGKSYSLESAEFKGKVISVFYVDPSKKNWNKHVEEALKSNSELDRDNNYVNIYISNLKASKMPDMIIKRAMKNKQENTGSLILLDRDYTLIKLWGMKNHSSNVVVLDKDKICRYKYSGKLSPEEVDKLIAVIKEYQFQW